MARRGTIELDILQVAGIICEHRQFDLDGSYDRAEVERLNDDPGWSYDVRYDREYTSATDFTRVEGRSLTSVQLDAAWRVADEWLRGDWRHAERVPVEYYRA